MKNLCFLFVFCFFSVESYCQDPYIAVQGGDGLGQYGYLEKDAVTFARLERNTYDNIAYLSARWWITDNNTVNGNGKEFIYHVYGGPDWDPMIGWQCGGDNYPSKRTTDYTATDFSPEWNAGTDCYVSVCAKFCDNNFAPSSFDGTTTNGATGFNERHFRVLDVDTSLHISTATNIPNTNGVCQLNNAYNVAGGFMMDPGAFTGISLTTLILKNNGTAAEQVNIPNSALSVYYEAATGSEVYGDGNETYAGSLNGDWDGNNGDNIFGSTALNIPLNGKIRVYVLLCNFNSPSADGKTINLALRNDGIFLSPALDGFTKLRINPGSISQRYITLPVRFLYLNGERNTNKVELKWQAASAGNTSAFIIQQSLDGRIFTDAGRISASPQNDFYHFILDTDAEYFRIIAIDNSGEKSVSNIIRVKNINTPAIKLMQNPVLNNLILDNRSAPAGKYMLCFTDAAGRVLARKNIVINPGRNELDLPPISSQVLFMHLQDTGGHIYNYKLLKQ
ncbi:MAG: hypothetical protein QM791_10690 [Ferruginibacter sp.]